MKRILLPFMLMALFIGYSCSSDDSKPSATPPQCSITAPKDGAVLNLYDDFVIKGTASDSDGSIAKVVLTVDGKAIADVTKAPFEYTVSAKDLKEGALKIVLTVTDDGGNTASDDISVTIQDLSEAPICSITAPETGASFESEDAIVVKGTGSVEGGTIAKAVLKINETVVESVTTVPFEYTLTDEQKAAGDVEIALEVTDNHGKTASDKVTITILGQFRDFTDVRDGKVYKTVKIGTQVWFAENLAYLPVVNPGEEGAEDAGKENQPMYYVYGYFGSDVAEAKATDEYKESGVLYNYWATLNGAQAMADRLDVSTVQGPCPDGWHVPSSGEWGTLSDWIGAQIPDSEGVMQTDVDGTPENPTGVRLIKNIIRKLKTPNGWSATASGFWTDEFPGCNKAGTDDYGFAGFPAGSRYSSGDTFYYYANGIGSTNLYFWTPCWDAVTFPSAPGGVSVSFGVKYELSFSRGGSEANRGYSLRCVKD